MSYFSNFPLITYNFEIDGKVTLIVVKDIALNVRVKKEILENIVLFDEYDIEDHETFDTISEKLYGKPIYHWVLMLLNSRFDYRKDFPMSQQQLMNYCIQKYGKEHLYDQHVIFGNLHYLDRNGNTVTKLTPEQFSVLYPYSSYQNYLDLNPDKIITETEYRATYIFENYIVYSRQFKPVINYDYEDTINESKRRIRVLNPALIEKVVADIKRLLVV